MSIPRQLASMVLAATTVVSIVVGVMQDNTDDVVEAARLVGQDTATPVTIAANDGQYIYDIPHDQPLAVEVIEATQTRDGARVAYIVFVRDGAGFVKLGPYQFDATDGVFAGAEVDAELFLAGANE
jgi:hypothetical protein